LIALKYQAYIFDYDYTLGDCTQAIVESANYALGRLGLAPAGTEAIRRTVGHTLQDSFSILTGKSARSDESLKYEKYFIEKADILEARKGELLPDTLPVLRRLKSDGIKTGIVSTKQRERLIQIMEAFKMTDLIDVIVGGDEVKLSKPDPEGLLVAVDLLRAPRSKTLYIGDTIIDAKTAHAAGIDFAAVTTGTTKRQEFKAYPHLKIMNNLGELL